MSSQTIKTSQAMTPASIILVITATATALIAGLFYAWSCSVTPGLAHVQDNEYIAAMQAMNRAILNPVFFASFMGTAVLLPLSTFLQYAQGSTTRFWLLLVASALYLCGVMGVTMMGNVPMNDTLDAFNLRSATAQQTADLRAKFEHTWNSLNDIRTVSSILTIVLVIIACMSRGKQ